MNETTILASTLSPEFIGMPTAPKAGEDADENQIANVGYVKDIIGETVSVDDDFSEESEHALQNKVITSKFESVDEAIADETLRATLAESALDTRIDEVIAGEAVFAPLDSPVFTGNPTVPNIDNNSTDFTIANKKYVDDTEANYYIDYNDVSITVQEIETAIDQGKNLFCVETDTNNVKHIYPLVYTEDPEYDPPELTLKFSDGLKELDLSISTTTVEWATASKSDSPIFTGTPQAPTAPAGTDTNQIATTAFVNDALTNSDAMRKGIDYVTAGYKSGTEIGLKATAEGNDVESSGDYSHAEGNQTIARGIASHAEGNFTVATGDYAHSEGNDTTASGDSSHAEGEDTVAVGDNSHAEGVNTNAIGTASHAEGDGAIVSGDFSHAEGVMTIANKSVQHVFGQYNIADNSSSEIVVNVPINIPQGLMKGDVNADGSITEEDSDLVRQYLSHEVELTELQLWSADVNNDGNVNNFDATNLRKYIAGEESILTTTPTFTDYYNNWTYTKLTDLTGEWSCEVSKADFPEEFSIDSITGYSNLTRYVVNDDNIQIYVSKPPIESVRIVAHIRTADPTGRGNYVEIVGNGLNSSNRNNARTLDWQGNEVLAGKLTVGTQPTNDNDVTTKKYVDDRLNPELPNVTNVDDGKVLTVVDGQWDKAEPQSGSELPEVTSADNGKVLTVVEGQWDKAEPSDDLSPVVIQLGVDDIELNPTNYRFTLSNDEVIELVHGALISAYHNKRPVYFDLTYHETGSEVVMYLNGYASIHGHNDGQIDRDVVYAVFSTWNRTNTLIYDFVAEAWYYGSDHRAAMSLKARS